MKKADGEKRSSDRRWHDNRRPAPYEDYGSSHLSRAPKEPRPRYREKALTSQNQRGP